MLGTTVKRQPNPGGLLGTVVVAAAAAVVVVAVAVAAWNLPSVDLEVRCQQKRGCHLNSPYEAGPGCFERLVEAAVAADTESHSRLGSEP